MLQVYLDKVKNVRCVVSKVNIIESTFRNFRMELLAGEQDTKVLVKQNGARFEFDFADVYWNPRLCTEHSRVIEQLRSGDVLYDVFAGVGPFAIPAARKGCAVFANDLNPHSFAWLNHNVKLNKVTNRVTTYNLDGREFIREVIVRTDDLEKKSEEGSVRVHCYCFVKGEEGVAGAKRKAEEGLKRPMDKDVQVSFVRNVAPNKDMMRVSFDLSLDVLRGVECQPPVKRCKVEGEEGGGEASVTVSGVE
ncbi:hypothetical protein HPB48_007248 [Haemaphysalis longicornis]|uniref:SAM-dependent methyltransferase TRM5/TYW2-type domain-containing protein n=1 Tax=Haemaphysalis longicornis TaxID=44386 RepID=A0A9J6H289_HAELO|nr:hypothetical protein HPB48_007248 [Haemaphysalis longicornis]